MTGLLFFTFPLHSLFFMLAYWAIFTCPSYASIMSHTHLTILCYTDPYLLVHFMLNASILIHHTISEWSSIHSNVCTSSHQAVSLYLSSSSPVHIYSIYTVSVIINRFFFFWNNFLPRLTLYFTKWNPLKTKILLSNIFKVFRGTNFELNYCVTL